MSQEDIKYKIVQNEYKIMVPNLFLIPTEGGGSMSPAPEPKYMLIFCSKVEYKILDWRNEMARSEYKIMMPNWVQN